MIVVLGIILAFCLLYFLVPRKYVGFVFFLVTAALTVVAYNAVPADTDDLFRYYDVIDILRQGGMEKFRQMLDTNSQNWGALPVCGYYFYFISLLPYNNFLPAITIFIVYGSMFLMLYKMANRFNVSKGHLFIATIFSLTTYWFYDTCSGIRNGLAFAIVLVCMYYHFVERKNIVLCIIGYVLACGLHTAGIVPVVLVVAALLTWKSDSKTINILMIFGLACGGILLDFLSRTTDSEFIQLLAGKTERATDFSTYTDIQTNFLVNVATYFICALIVLYCVYFIKHYAKDDAMKRFCKFVELTMFFMLGCMYSQLLFLRFARWILPVIIPMVYMVGMQLQQNNIDRGVNYGFHSEVKFAEIARYKTKAIFSLIILAYCAVHLWYDCNGSSLIWLHFE